MSERGGELVAADESAVGTEALLDAIVVENDESNGRLANSTNTSESERSEVFCHTDYLLDQVVSSKDVPRWWRQRFSRYTRCKYKTLDPLTVEVADLAGV